MREPKIGDRYKDSVDDCVFEVIDTVRHVLGEIYAAKVQVVGGEMHDNYHIDKYDTYLGNFSKSKNFSNLYNLLNEKD